MKQGPFSSYADEWVLLSKRRISGIQSLAVFPRLEAFMGRRASLEGAVNLRMTLSAESRMTAAENELVT